MAVRAQPLDKTSRPKPGKQREQEIPHEIEHDSNERPTHSQFVKRRRHVFAPIMPQTAAEFHLGAEIRFAEAAATAVQQAKARAPTNDGTRAPCAAAEIRFLKVKEKRFIHPAQGAPQLMTNHHEGPNDT